MADNPQDFPLHTILEQTASSLATALDRYWPGVAGLNGDLSESNIVTHLAAVLIQRHFAVFTEACYAQQAPSGKRRRSIDLLAIAPTQDWFLACEFWSAGFGDQSMVQKITDDLRDLSAFHLNVNIREYDLGPEPLRVLQTCQQGIALGVGRHWQSHKKGYASIDGPLSRCPLNAFQATMGPAIHVRDYTGAGWPGAYYLNYAWFPLTSSPRV